MLANVYFAVDELARELKDKSKGYKTKPSRATVRKTHPKNLPPKAAFRSLTNAATAATTRDSASLLSNKRVRGVVHEGNGLMHLHPRESTYNARKCSAKHRHELWFTFNQSAYWEKKVEGKPAKHIILG